MNLATLPGLLGSPRAGRDRVHRRAVRSLDGAGGRRARRDPGADAPADARRGAVRDAGHRRVAGGVHPRHPHGWAEGLPLLGPFVGRRARTGCSCRWCCSSRSCRWCRSCSCPRGRVFEAALEEAEAAGVVTDAAAPGVVGSGRPRRTHLRADRRDDRARADARQAVLRWTTVRARRPRPDGASRSRSGASDGPRSRTSTRSLEAAARFLEARPRSVAEVRRRLTTAGLPAGARGGGDRPAGRARLPRRRRVRAGVGRVARSGPAARRARVAARAAAEGRRRRARRARSSTTGDGGAEDADARTTTSPSDADRAAADRLLARHARSLARVADPRVRRQRAYALLARNGFDPSTAGGGLARAHRRQPDADEPEAPPTPTDASRPGDRPLPVRELRSRLRR